MAKRGFDIVFSLAGLVLLLPVLLAVALMVKLDDRGPVFFRQIRVGRYGRTFRIAKFRTMGVGADRKGPGITAAGDRRVTRTGRVLRRTKLDELPQLWNVLCGEMSFVGPRPEIPGYVALYTPEQRSVLDLRPGITDEATIAFRDEEALLAAAADPEKYYLEHCLPRKISLNLAYARRAGVLGDVGVILRTIGAVWMRR
jgi:lipopolysaccharide/colanic/teichoic acid biosynthesis glycosyltransferase